MHISICKASGELRTEDIAIEGENSHFRRPHSHLTPPHQQVPKLIIHGIIFDEFQCVSSQSANVTDRQRDVQTDNLACHNRATLCFAR